MLEEIKTLLEKGPIHKLRWNVTFSGQEKWHFLTHLGPQRSEKVFKTSKVQDVNYPKSETHCMSGRLVCVRRSERCLLPNSNFGGTQAIFYNLRSMAGCSSSES